MRVPIVFLDANVLYSKTLRDWIFLLREETAGGLFTVVSSNDVIAEALYSIRRNKPLAPGHATARPKEIIESALDDIVRDFPAGASFPGGDRHDVHVHAAATACNASYVITSDKGFHTVADQLEYEVHTADSFLQLVAENMPQAVDRVILRQNEYRSNRGATKTLSTALIDARCPTFAVIVDRHLRAIAQGRTTTGIAGSVEFIPTPLVDSTAPAQPAATPASTGR
jgi:FAD/FMN-containing dehydrogenase